MSAVSDTDAADDLYIAGRFEVLGSFSENIMYARDRRKCCDRDFQSIVMVKTTDIASKKSLDREIEVYKALGDTVGFPNLKSFGEWDDMCFIVMDYKGCNLERLRFNLPAYFDPPTVAMFAIQMIERIKHLHTVGFIHGDIRPDNFTLGPEAPGYTGMRGVARVNLIDFSTASPVEGEWDTRLSRVSNPAFSSIKTLLGHHPAKRDDLESLAYTLLYLVMGDGLPWIKEIKSCWLMGPSGDDFMASLKSEIVPEELCKGLPSVYARFLRYTRELDAKAHPDYDGFMEEFGKACFYG